MIESLSDLEIILRSWSSSWGGSVQLRYLNKEGVCCDTVRMDLCKLTNQIQEVLSDQRALIALLLSKRVSSND